MQGEAHKEACVKHSKSDGSNKNATATLEDWRAFFKRISERDRRRSSRRLVLHVDSAQLFCEYVSEEMRVQLAILFDHLVMPSAAEVATLPENAIWYANDMRACLDHAIAKMDEKFIAVFHHAWEIALHELTAETLYELNGKLTRHLDKPIDMLHEVVDRSTREQRRRLSLHRGRPKGTAYFLGREHAFICLFRAAQIAWIVRQKINLPILVEVLNIAKKTWADIPQLDNEQRLGQVMRDYSIKLREIKELGKRVPEWIRGEDSFKPVVDEYKKKLGIIR